MKRNILLAATIGMFSLMSLGCSKDDDVSGEVGTEYLKVKVDGVEKNFSVVSAYWADGENTLSMNGTTMDGNKPSEALMISVISDDTRVPAGQYSLDDATSFTILAAHMHMQGTGQVNSGATRDTETKDDAFNLKIDKIDNSHVQGSFSGVLAQTQGLNTLGKITLTDGKFSLKIKPN